MELQFSTTCLLKPELQHTRIFKNLLFLLTPKYEPVMKSLSFRHPNTHIFLCHTSCACAIRDTPETEASPTLQQFARLRSCKRKHSSSFGWPKANPLCGCSAVRVKEILSAKRFGAGLTSVRKAGLC